MAVLIIVFGILISVVAVMVIVRQSTAYDPTPLLTGMRKDPRQSARANKAGASRA